MPPHTKTLLRERRVVAAFEAGHTVAQIGAAEGLRRTQVGRILKKHGIPYPGSRTPLDPAITARLTDATWLAAEYASKSAAQIARELGVTQPRVRDALERAGIPAGDRRNTQPWPSVSSGRPNSRNRLSPCIAAACRPALSPGSWACLASGSSGCLRDGA